MRGMCERECVCVWQLEKGSGSTNESGSMHAMQSSETKNEHGRPNKTKNKYTNYIYTIVQKFGVTYAHQGCI